MPISPRYDWSQSPGEVTIRVQLKHVQKAKFRVSASPFFLKVNYAPFILDVDLRHEVVYRDIVVRILPKHVELICPKVEEALWTELEVKGDKKELQARREASIKRAEEAKQKTLAEHKEAKKAAKNAAQKSHWSVQDKHKSAIEELKQKDIDDANQEVVDFAEGYDSKAEDDHLPKSPADLYSSAAAATEPRVKEIWAEVPSREHVIRESGANLPPVRATKKIEVVFSKKAKKGMPLRGDHNSE